MSFSVLKLITNAYYESGIVSREFETVNGAQAQDGLDTLNDVLTDKAIEKDMLPYYSQYNINFVAGQEKYFIPNLELADTTTFFLNNVRYSMREIQRKSYFGDSRANNISTLPFNYHYERTTGGSNLFVYFFPNTNYPIEIWGLFRLGSVAINQDLTSSIASVDLGNVIINGAGHLNTGQLVINGVDLVGTYASPTALATQINSVVPNVNANLVFADMTLTNSSGSNITLVTSANANPTNSVSFYNFNTVAGIPLQQIFFPLNLDRFYISYLKYYLAMRLCEIYNFAIPPGVQKQVDRYELWISKRSAPMDLSMQKISTLSSSTSLNYAEVNLGLGWTTP